MHETVGMDYGAECNRLRELMSQKEDEHCYEVNELTNTLVNYEREIEILKAKLSVVEMIFKK